MINRKNRNKIIHTHTHRLEMVFYGGLVLWSEVGCQHVPLTVRDPARDRMALVGPIVHAHAHTRVHIFTRIHTQSHSLLLQHTHTLQFSLSLSHHLLPNHITFFHPSDSFPSCFLFHTSFFPPSLSGFTIGTLTKSLLPT